MTKKMYRHLIVKLIIPLILIACICMNVPVMASESTPSQTEQNAYEENVTLQADIDSESVLSEDSSSGNAVNHVDVSTLSEEPANDKIGAEDSTKQEVVTIPEQNMAMDQLDENGEEVSQSEGELPDEEIDPRVILLMGDSYAAGTKKTVMEMTESGSECWPNYLSDELNDYICYTYACAGTGFLSWWNGYTLPKMLEYAIRDSKNGTFVDPQEVRWVIIAAGYNDRHEWYDPQKLRSSIISFVKKAQTEFPNAKIAIGEIGWCRSDKENAAFDQGQILDVVVPIYREASVSAGAYYIENIEYVLRNHEDAIGRDGVHPTSIGSQLIASYISNYLNNIESGVTEIEYYYPDGSLCDTMVYDTSEQDIESHPVIDLGDGMQIVGWERNRHLQTTEYSGEFTPQEWMEENGSYTQLYGVLDTEDSTYTGFKKIGDTWLYFYRGQVREDSPTVINGKCNETLSWWYVDETGKVDFSYTGFAKNKNGWWYVVNGKVDFTKNDVLQGTVNGKTAWYYIVNNKVTPGPTVAQNKNGWWYIGSSGFVGFTYNGFAKNKNGWWYAVDGKVDFTRNDVVHGTINGKTAWYYIVHNKLTAGPTVAQNKNGWWYVDNTGKVNYGYTGFARNKSGWWYAVNGKVDFTRNDVVRGTINGKTAWYYIVHNKLTAGPTVAQNKNGWWYIDNTGKVDFSYTGFAKNKNGWWYIVNGKVDFSKNGFVRGTIDNKTASYQVVNGKIFNRK